MIIREYQGISTNFGGIIIWLHNINYKKKKIQKFWLYESILDLPSSLLLYFLTRPSPIFAIACEKLIKKQIQKKISDND